VVLEAATTFIQQAEFWAVLAEWEAQERVS
jgi:hypothetical protein